jgi:hypothetical protein
VRVFAVDDDGPLTFSLLAVASLMFTEVPSRSLTWLISAISTSTSLYHE